MRHERLIHLGGVKAPALAVSTHLIDVYAVMESLRNDEHASAVPVTLVIGKGRHAMDAKLPGRYLMDAAGDLIVASTEGVVMVETRRLRDDPGRAYLH